LPGEPTFRSSAAPSTWATRPDDSIEANSHHQIPPDSLEEILVQLKEQRALLVFDNCEHLIDAVASMVESIIESCPAVSVLATSRESLAIPRECVRQLESLDYNGRQSAASDLFIQRVKSLTGMVIPADKFELVERIVSRLEGVPLAIELAVPRVRALTLDELLEELSDQLTALSHSRRGRGRHATLDRTIHWSFGLLSTGEQRALQQLAVFAAPFTREAAVALTGPEHGKHLHRLVEQSVLLRRDCGDTVRYRMLEPYRQFCLNQTGNDEPVDNMPDTSLHVRRRLDLAFMVKMKL